MKKLIINYTGGLGNQLFQYAAAKNLFYTHSYKLFSFKNDLKKTTTYISTKCPR